MVEGLGQLIELKKSPLEGSEGHEVPEAASLQAVLQKLIHVQALWGNFHRLA